MSSSQRQTRNNPREHFISPAAHYMEEAYSNLSYTIDTDTDLPDNEKVRIKILMDHIARSYLREAKRRGNRVVASRVLQSLRQTDTTPPKASGRRARK